MDWLFAVVIILLLVFFNGNYSNIKGRVGESYVSRKLKKLDQEKYTIFNDLYVPVQDGGTTQVDHIVTSPYGIFVIETKHYKGWIFGSEHQKHWTQVIYKRKEKMFNPIWQNSGHIKALMDSLEVDKQLFHNIIAFSDQSTFKFKEPFTKAEVIHFDQLLPVIRKQGSPVFSEFQLKRINQRLASLIITDRKEKKSVRTKHIQSVKRKTNNNVRYLKTANCPKCGSPLVERRGKYGSFLGCDNYPKCRFTSKIS